jgi:ATP adenylyltransferase
MTEEDENIFKHHLQAVGKLGYVKGTARPQVDCIMCCIRDDDPRVDSLKVFQDDQIFISLNKYPYNPGHLMVAPSRHVENFNELSDEERNYLFKRVMDCQRLLQDIFQPTGFNVGYNQGDFAGASIKHIHVHVVPRYKGELGFIDIIGDARVVPEGVESVRAKIEAKIAEYFLPEY